MVNSLVFTKTDTYKFKRAEMHSSWDALYPEIKDTAQKQKAQHPDRNMELLLNTIHSTLYKSRLHLFQYLCFDIEATFFTHH